MFPITVHLLLFTFGIFLAATYRWYKRHFNYWTKHNVIPSVPGRIFSGNIKDIMTFKTNFGFHMKTIYDDPKFQNEAVVGVYALQPALLVRDPDLIKSILIRDFDSFRNRFWSIDMETDPIGGQTILFCNNDTWKLLRAKIGQIFTGSNLKQMYPLIRQVGGNLENYLQTKGERFVCECKDLSYRFTIDAIATTTLGIASNSLANPLEEVNVKSRQLTLFNFKRALDFLIISFIPQFNKIFKPRVFFKETENFLRSTTTLVLRERERSGIRRNDMIDVFVKLKEEAMAGGENLEEFMDFLTAQMATFMAGGTETSSTTIAYFLLEMAKHPLIQSRLREEILQAFIKGNGSLSYEAINDLQYLQMTIDETRRVYPILPLIERKYSKSNDKSDSYSLRPFYDFDIPEGMAVYISTFGLHYDPKYWTDPMKFNPERFAPENKKSLNPMIYLPFGDGPHMCIGARLGNLQIKACIVHLLKNHCVRVCPETNLNPEFNGKAFFLQIKGGINLEVVKDDLYTRTVN